MSLNVSSESRNSVKLQVGDGKIANVSVYPSRAHITRSFKFPAKTGHNSVTITGLPIAQFEDDSVRFEGNETTFIQDYTISSTSSKPASVPKEAPKPIRKEDALEEQQKLNAIARIEDAKKALSTYFSSLSIANVAPDFVQSCINNYIKAGTDLDQQLLQLRSELEEVRKRMHPKQSSPSPPPSPFKPTEKSVVVSVYCESEGDAEITFHYAVNSAGWKPVYDIMIDSETKKVKLLYKASVTQRSGEDWMNAKLTLETSVPKFAGDLRPLSPWRLRNSDYGQSNGNLFGGGVFASQRVPQSARSGPVLFGASTSSHDMRPMAAVNNNPEDPHSITTLEVPEPKTILGDGTVHKVTVAELELDGELKWVAIPKTGSVMHWTASIENKSIYPILKGAASVYVNKSFISRTEIPYTSPKDRFNCSLGVDPSIQVIYHPREKKNYQRGFIVYNEYEQRITVINKKSCAIANVKVIDQIPVSEDDTITVKILAPTLPMRDERTGKSEDMDKSVQVSEGVVARWEKGDNEEVHVDKLGSDGKLSWSCSVPSHGKVDLALSWEVAHQVGHTILGL